MKAAILLFLVACTAPRAPRVEPGFSAQEQAQAAVLITRICVTGDPITDAKMTMVSALGSGTVVGVYDVLTAAHVIDCGSGSPIINVYDYTARRRVADVAAINYVGDVARLTVREPFKGARSPGFEPARSGEMACVYVAFPHREEKCRRVASTGPVQVGFRVVDIETSFGVEPGNSGSGIFNDGGRLIGIATHSENVMGLCAVSSEFCYSRAASPIGKRVLP